MREVAAEAEKPVMLYSIGKDSAVMLDLAMRAFAPAKPPFPLLHVDTTWKFRDTDVMKTQALKQALDEHGFDVAFGGARRDEERSLASSPSPTGPSSTSGSTSTGTRSRSCRCTWRPSGRWSSATER
jgi:3'-phosphoadenosine 5'-phosphosulfate sulfotransferase (PAPS reductase)/FAD synthetase